LPLKFFVVLLALFSVFAAHIFEKNKDKKAEKQNYGNLLVTFPLYNSVRDSDTFSVDVKNYLPDFPYIFRHGIIVQLNHINTPKLNGHCEKERELASQAKRFLENALRSAERIELKEMERSETCFCIIARVYVDDKDLAGELIRVNLGVPSFKRTTQNDWCI